MNVQPTSQQDTDILPDISIDCLVFGLDGGRLNVLLAQHREGLGQGQWALPGGHIGRSEDLDGAASRILQDVTGARDLYLEQLRAFGRADRFPGGRVITVAYYALVKQEDYELVAGGPASAVSWPVVSSKAMSRLKWRIETVLSSFMALSP